MLGMCFVTCARDCTSLPLTTRSRIRLRASAECGCCSLFASYLPDCIFVWFCYLRFRNAHFLRTFLPASATFSVVVVDIKLANFSLTIALFCFRGINRCVFRCLATYQHCFYFVLILFIQMMKSFVNRHRNKTCQGELAQHFIYVLLLVVVLAKILESWWNLCIKQRSKLCFFYYFSAKIKRFLISVTV